MVYDIVTYFNEIELLEWRLDYLADHVDIFVIAESDKTHTGKTKSYNLESRIGSLAEKYKIVYVQHRGSEIADTAWYNENSQRNSALHAINLNDDDIVMISDVDEIPSISFIEWVKLNKGRREIFIAIQELSYFWPNFRSSETPFWQGGTRALLWRDRNLINERSISYSSTFLSDLNKDISLTKLRLISIGMPFRKGGWHMSYYGGKDRIIKKLGSFAHVEDLMRIGDPDLFVENFLLSHRGFFGSESYRVFGTFPHQGEFEMAPVKVVKDIYIYKGLALIRLYIIVWKYRLKRLFHVFKML